MNTRIAKFASTAALLVGAALFAPALAMAGNTPAASPGVLAIDCATKSRPSQVAVGQSLGIDNLSATYDARSRLMAEVHRACHRKGTTQVQIAIAPPQKRIPLPAAQVAVVPAVSSHKPR